MYCENCGSELSEKSKFCPECGTPVSATTETTSAADVDVATTSQGAPEPPMSESAPMDQKEATQEAPEVPVQQTPPPPAGAPVKSDGPWYGKTWVIVLFLIFLWPVGLVLMWLKTCHWKLYAKIIISCACAGLLFLQIFSWVTILNQPAQVLDPSYTTASSSAAPSSSASAPSKSAPASKSSNNSNANSKYLNDGIPNILAVMNLSGADLASLCEQAGMKWSSQDGVFKGKIGGVEVGLARATDDEKNSSEKTIESQDALVKTSSPAVVKVYIQSSNLKEATHKFLTGLEADASALKPDQQTSLYIMNQENGGSALVFANWNPETKVTTIYCYNDAFCKSGLLPDTMDGGKKGLSANQAFDYFAQLASKDGWQVAG